MCVYICIYTSIYIYVCIGIYVYIHVYIYVYIYLNLYIGMSIYIYIYMSIWGCPEPPNVSRPLGLPDAHNNSLLHPLFEIKFRVKGLRV